MGSSHSLPSDLVTMGKWILCKVHAKKKKHVGQKGMILFDASSSKACTPRHHCNHRPPGQNLALLSHPRLVAQHCTPLPVAFSPRAVGCTQQNQKRTTSLIKSVACDFTARKKLRAFCPPAESSQLGIRLTHVIRRCTRRFVFTLSCCMCCCRHACMTGRHGFCSLSWPKQVMCFIPRSDIVPLQQVSARIPGP